MREHARVREKHKESKRVCISEKVSEKERERASGLERERERESKREGESKRERKRKKERYQDNQGGGGSFFIASDFSSLSTLSFSSALLSQSVHLTYVYLRLFYVRCALSDISL